ncbi:MAG: hypothetical protein K6E38_05780 [Fretibacterium sp.]|nr:hypothetical protein [Fretibacterium sp.]
MKKLFTYVPCKVVAALAMLLAVMSAGCASADPKISFTVYQCLACDKLFQSFPGDQLERKEFRKGDEQLKRVFQFGNRGKNFPPCRKFKYHIFEKKGTNSTGLSTLSKSSMAENVAVVRDGGSLSGITLTEWECVYCKKHFYSLNNENLNIRDWERQRSYLFNLKGRPIPECSARDVWGHIFYPKKTSSVKSYELAVIVNDLYWVKN